VSKKLPFVKSDIPRDLRTFLDRVRELVSGSGSDRLISLDDLTSAGLAGSNSSGQLVAPTQPFVASPPAPTNLTATAAVRSIFVEWDAPAYPGHAYAEVWGASTNSLGAAVLLGMSPGGIYVDDTGPSTTRFYWVRFANTNDVKGPYNATSGTSATTGPEVSYLLEQLAGEITTSELSDSLNSRINLIDGPATTIGTIPNQLAFLQGQVDAITSYPDYDNAETYAADDIVKYDGGLYKAISATTGNLPTDGTYWLKIGDYSSIADVVAAHTAEIATLTSDLGGEVTARETLATQMRGAYTGTDLASVTSGLIFSERTARTTADSGLASSISAVSATAASKNRIFRQTTAPTSPQVNDIWVDTTISYADAYFEQDFSKVKNKQFQWDGASWLNITDVDIEDNFALVVREQTARATADEALAQDILTLNAGVNANDLAIRAALEVEATTRANADGALSSLVTTLDSQVNNPTTGLPATRATLLNDYSTTATVDGAIAQSTTTLKAYTNTTASRTFRQNDAPTRRGEDSGADVPLQVGDVWVDIDEQNKLYQWSGTAWVYSPDGAVVEQITDLGATLTNDYLTQTDTENAIAQNGTFLRAYADNTSTVFRQADPPSKRGVDPETADDIPLRSGDVWYDTNDFNKLYLWSGTAWVYSPDGVITQSVTTVDARVTTVETTQIGYCTIDGVASDDTNRADCEDAGGVWNVGIPLATAVKQVSVSDGEDSATLEQRFTAQKTLNDGLKAEYTIKLDVNGNVAGYGIYGDEGGSEFVANVDRFAVTTPQTSIQLRANSTTYAVGAIARVEGADSKTLVCKVGGTTGASAPTIGAIGTMVTDGTLVWQVASRVPFAVQAVPTQINGQDVPAGVYVDAAYILNATVQNAQIADLAVDDSKISDVSVGTLTAGSIAADQYIQSSNYLAGTQGFRLDANGNAEFQNAVVRGTVYATDGQFVGEVIAEDSGGNKARMWSGNFEIYKQVPTVGLVLYKALSRVESGVGANNVQVAIPGYFTVQPRVIVSPASMTLYNKDYANQNQSIQCEARDLVETSAGSMSWRFTPLATLSLAANTGQTVVNASSGSISTGWTSSQYTTPANTASITPNITLTSLRGTGTSGGYYLRTVRWKVEYLSGGVWVSSSWTTSALGATAPATITTNTTFSFPSAGTWTFRIVTEAYDSGGTFSTGTQYETATDNISRTGDVQVTSTTSSPVTLNYTPTYSVPSGWTVTGVTYNFVYSYFLGSSNFGSASVSGSGIFHSIGSNTSASGDFISRSYSRSNNLLSFTATGYSISVSYATARLTLHSVTGVVTRQRPLTNSTTASNSFSFNYYDYNLTSAEVLATGTLNWIAIGE
jgi:hypothetical protein